MKTHVYTLKRVMKYACSRDVAVLVLRAPKLPQQAPTRSDIQTIVVGMMKNKKRANWTEDWAILGKALITRTMNQTMQPNKISTVIMYRTITAGIWKGEESTGSCREATAAHEKVMIEKIRYELATMILIPCHLFFILNVSPSRYLSMVKSQNTIKSAMKKSFRIASSKGKNHPGAIYSKVKNGSVQNEQKRMNESCFVTSPHLKRNVLMTNCYRR